MAKFDLWFDLYETRDDSGAVTGVAGALEYALDLFDRSSAQVLADRLVRLLEAAVAASDTPIGRLEVLSPAERRAVLTDWNATVPERGPLQRVWPRAPHGHPCHPAFASPR